mgnify:CR=1 FL=1
MSTPSALSDLASRITEAARSRDHVITSAPEAPEQGSTA